jgi:hypothetical protein
MAAALITTASTLMCPHGATVMIASSNATVDAVVGVALATDTFTIAGCPFQIPVGVGTVPHPCVTVQWIKPNMETLVNGVPTLAQDSVGLCLAADQVPQGPVQVVTTQPIVSGG